MHNKELHAETKADSSTTAELISSAQMPQNQMLVAVLSAFVSAYEWVREDSFVGYFIDEWLDFITSAFKLKSSFNWLGLFTLYPMFITIAFVISFSMLIIFSVIATLLGAVGYSIIGIFCLIGLIFMKRDVSKNSH